MNRGEGEEKGDRREDRGQRNRQLRRKQKDGGRIKERRREGGKEN